MASGFEKVPSNSHKHDPAWKHCHMSKVGDKVHLKCIYCGKIYRGGGIHRIKEHLACQKGNASVCYSVPADVRHAMQQSLDSLVVKRRINLKIPSDRNGTTTIIQNSTDDVDAAFANECSIDTDIPMISNPSALERCSSLMSPRDEGLSAGVLKKRKRGRPPKTAAATHDANDDSVDVSDGRFAQGSCIKAPLKTVNPQVQLAIGRFLYDVGVPLDAVNSVYFQPMIDAIASEGARTMGPTHHDLRGWVLKSAVDEVRGNMDYCERAWARTGCSVLVEECNMEKGMKCLNFFVYCPEGTIFYKSVDITNIIDIIDGVFESVKQVVEAVGVKNVLQVITPDEECYAAVGKRLSDAYPTLYWAPCAASSIILMLEDFEKFEWINSALEQCKSITRFVYNHSFVLNMMRRYTFGVDLVVPDVSPIVTSFRTVKRILDLKHNLQGLVTSQEWVDSHYSKREGGLLMLDLISDHSFWSSCNMIVTITEPLLRALSIVKCDKKSAMGYIYAAIYRAKESLKREVGKREDYLGYWNIIDQRWEQQQQLPLHAAGFYLNPKFFYSVEGDVPGTIVSGMFDCIERLVPDTNIQDRISKELNSYRNVVGDFGRKMAIRARDSLLPWVVVCLAWGSTGKETENSIHLYIRLAATEWWSTYGGACPNLSRLAVRILSQCCSLNSCKPDLTLLAQLHKTTNSLEHQRLSDQVFTQFNLRLRQMSQRNKEHDNTDPLSVDNHDSVADWIAKKETCLDDLDNFDWMAVEPPISKMLLKLSVDEVEQLGAGFDDDDIFGVIKDEDETIAD